MNATVNPRHEAFGLNRRASSQPAMMRQASMATWLMDQKQLDQPLFKRRVFWMFLFVSLAALCASIVGFFTYLTNYSQINNDIPPPLFEFESSSNPGDACEFYLCPTTGPTNAPTTFPTVSPTKEPTTPNPTQNPTTSKPTTNPTNFPTPQPTDNPTTKPTDIPTHQPTGSP
mmetsp:Transcript_18732/g.23839  ORF Transcript_18732/g.23839 Transcript_18732/m.23839 type:complete len:172 (+) Transcript_18732:55-570(+)